MSAEGGDGKGGSLLRTKLGPTGLEVDVGSQMPGLLRRLLPFKTRVRGAIDEAIAEKVVAQLHTGAPLDEAAMAFVEDFASDQAQKYIRLSQIEQRAQALLERDLPPPSPRLLTNGEPAKETSTDWLNRFREDASLVDDQIVREIYSRILAEEARRPRSFSLRTLAVLRYLDHETATAFGRLQQVLIGGDMIPEQTQFRSPALEAANLSHSTLLILKDAGLVNAETHSTWTSADASVAYYVCSGHRRVLRMRRHDGAPFSARLQIHLLTPAGRELARIAAVEPEPAIFGALAEWIRSRVGVQTEFETHVADVPERAGEIVLADLDWKPYQPHK